MNPKTRIDMVTVNVTNVNALEFNLGNLPSIDNAAKVNSIEAFSVDTISTAPNGNSVVNANVFNKAYLVLIRGNSEIVRYPLASLKKANNNGLVPEFQVVGIDPQKSKIVIPTTANLVLNESFLLAFTYDIN